VKLITLDAETFYGDGYSLSNKDMTTEKYIRDPRFKCHGFGVSLNFGPAKWVSHRNVEAALARFDWNECALVGHNLQFDGAILAWHYGIYPKLYIDTLGLSRALIGPHLARHGLKYVAEKLCGMTKMDDLSKAYNHRDLPAWIEERLADYTVGEPRWNESKGMLEAGDVVLTNAIAKKLLPHFPKEELSSLDWTIRAFTNPQLFLDAELLDQYIQEVKQNKIDALNNAGLTSRDLLMSNNKYAEALEALSVTPPTKINAKGKVTYAFAKTDEEHKALLEHDDPDVQALVAARLEVKSTIEETRAILYRDAAGRGAWPVGYNYAGAQVTQRYSGNKGGGGNPMNLKRGGTLRRAIYAPEGYVLGVADYMQIECRLVLWMGMQITGPDGEEAKALELMRQGQDIYGWFGSKIYGVEITKQTHPLERQIAKSGLLGLGYGMGAARFIEYCKANGINGVDEQFANSIVRLYRNTFKGVTKLWRQANTAVTAMLDERHDVELPIATSTQSHSLVITTHDPLFDMPAILLPGGLCVKYPGLAKDVEGRMTYLDGAKPVKLFGGKIIENCIGSETEVLTLNGWKRIIEVSPEDLLWDGCAWVPHDGVIEQGEQDTIDFGGISITPEHKVDINEQWTEANTTTYEEAAASYQRHYRLP
jgi:DNA polymerase